jgi:hypothetical protein
MKPQNQQRNRGFVRFLFRVIATASLMAGLAAVAATVFGILCGLFFWARYGEAGMVAAMVSHCAVAGAAAGALVGGLGRLLDGASHPGEPHRQARQPVLCAPRNGYCLVGVPPLWNAKQRQEPFPNRGGPRLTS